MQRHSITPIRIKKVKIAFSKNMMTAYTGLSRMDSLYTGTGGNRTVQEHSPNSMSVYSKIIMYISIAYASTDRFVHMGCLGTKHSLQLYSGYKGCPRQQHLLPGFSTRSRAFTMRISILQPLVYLVQLIQRECRVLVFIRQSRPSYHQPIAFLNKITVQFVSGTDQAMQLCGIHFSC